jgi:hypothetical protein
LKDLRSHLRPVELSELQRFASGVEGFVNPVLNKIDALLTLTGFPSVADEAVLQRQFLSFQSQQFTNPSDGSLTWHDSCTLLIAGSFEESV